MEQLEKFEQKQVAQISKFQVRSNELKVTADELTIDNDEDLTKARDIVKEINAHKKEVSEKRLALTQPFNNVISQLIAKEKEVLLPLAEGKTAVSDKIITYSEEVERRRLEEEKRINDIVEDLEHFASSEMDSPEEVDMNGAGLKETYDKLPDTDKSNPTIKLAFMATVGKLSERKNQIIEEQRIENERIRQAEEQKRLDEEAEKQSEEQARLASERKAVEDEKREIEEQKLQMQREKDEIERQKEIQKTEAEALKLKKQQNKAVKAVPKTNKVTTTKFEIIDESKVDRIYCSPDEKLIREAIRLGVKTIAGVRIYEETKVR